MTDLDVSRLTRNCLETRWWVPTHSLGITAICITLGDSWAGARLYAGLQRLNEASLLFQQKCTVGPVTGSASEANLKTRGERNLSADVILETAGLMARQVGEKRNRRNCTRGAFSVISTTGSMKLRRRSANLCYKLSDAGSRYWEDLSTPDCSVNTLMDENNPGTSFSATHMTQPVEDHESFETAAVWVLPATGSHDDIDMEPATDLQRKRDGFYAGLINNMPQRASSSSELPKGLGVFDEELGMVHDHSLLMDVDSSDPMRILHGPVACPLSRPLLPEPLGDIIMHDEARIRKSKELSLLERVGETLRQKKLRATQA